MSTNKLKDKNIRKLTRMGTKGTSLGLTLPIEMVKDLKWKERQRVKVKRISGGLQIKDCR